MKAALALGAEITHRVFGPGEVVALEDDRYSVRFSDGSQKQFLRTLAPVSLGSDQLREVTFDADHFDHEVREETRKTLLRLAVQKAVRQAQEPAGDPPDVGLLAEVLARPSDPPMRCDGLIPSDASTLVVAQRKTGKTTLELNYAQALITGTPLLGRFDTRPIAGNVALLNYEVSGATVARWADEHGVDGQRLVLVNLRGRRNPLSHPEDREGLAAQLRLHDVEAVIVDPFGRAYTGKSQNDSGEVGAWLIDLDMFVRAEIGATDLLLSAHAGWNGERTRGASALEDWADVVITMTRGEGDDEDARFVRAIGRDVDVDEDRLDFHGETRTLRLAGAGSRRQIKDTRKVADLAVFACRAARQSPGASVTALENLIKAMDDAPAFRNGEVSRAAKYAQQQGLMRVEQGGGGRRSAHFVVEDPTSPTSPQPLPGTATKPLPPLPIGERFGGDRSETEALPLPDDGGSA